MHVILYSTGCPRCRVLETKLGQKNISFSIVDDISELERQGIMTVPVLEVEGKKMDFVTANSWINAQEVQDEN